MVIMAENGNAFLMTPRGSVSTEPGMDIRGRLEGSLNSTEQLLTYGELKTECPRSADNILSRFVFSWMLDIIYKASKTTLSLKHFQALCLHSSADYLTNSLSIDRKSRDFVVIKVLRRNKMHLFLALLFQCCSTILGCLLPFLLM